MSRTSACLAAAIALLPPAVMASSHREAPFSTTVDRGLVTFSDTSETGVPILVNAM